MGHSSLLGTEIAARRAQGHDAARLGPGDTSDSGSDMAGLDEELESADHVVPVDVALRDSEVRPGMPGAALDDSGDSSGTGERSSAGLDGGRREAADISTDRIFTPGDNEGGDDEFQDPDLAFIDAAEAGDVLEDEESDDEDEEDDDLNATGAASKGGRS